MYVCAYLLQKDNGGGKKTKCKTKTNQRTQYKKIKQIIVKMRTNSKK